MINRKIISMSKRVIYTIKIIDLITKVIKHTRKKFFLWLLAGAHFSTRKTDLKTKMYAASDNLFRQDFHGLSHSASSLLGELNLKTNSMEASD